MHKSSHYFFWSAVLAVMITACPSNHIDNKSGKADKALTLETVAEADPDGNLLQFTRRDSDGVKEGVFTKKTSKGVKLEEANYQNGKLNGQRVLYYPSGDTLIVESYLDDVFEGVYKSFYPNGQHKVICTYRNNKIEGTWLQFYDSGQLKEEVLFVDNAENGPFKEYHLNGQLSVEGSYKDGDNEQGPLKFYDEQGLHYKTMECSMGICRTVWSLEKIKGNKGKVKKSKG